MGTSNPTANRSATVAATTDMGELDVFAVGLANPRGCSFDSEMPDYLYCANVDEVSKYVIISYHQLDLLVSGGEKNLDPLV